MNEQERWDDELSKILDRISKSDNPLLQSEKETIRYWNAKPKNVRERVIKILPLSKIKG